MNKDVALIVGLLVMIAISGCISSDDNNPSASIEMADAEVAAEPQDIDTVITETSDTFVSDPAAEYYNPKVYGHYTFEESAFEDIHGADISGYRQDYINEGGSKLNHASTTLLSENPNHLGVPFYTRIDVSSQLGPGATMEFYTPLDNPEVMGAYAEAMKQVDYRIPYTHAAVTMPDGTVHMFPYFSNTAKDYPYAAQTGGLNSEMYKLNKEFYMDDGIPESYFDIVESKLGY